MRLVPSVEVVKKGASQGEASRSVVEGKKKKSEAGARSSHMEEKHGGERE